jgi:hypothetical protein
MPNGGIFGGNETPHNYAVQPTAAGDMSSTVFGGIKEGMAMSDDLLKSKIEAMQRAQQQAMQQELGQAAENPDPQTLLKLSIKYPSLAKDFKISQDQLGEQQKKATLDQMLPVHAALNNGNVDAAVQTLQQQADAQRNSGKPQDADRTENMIKVIQGGGTKAVNTSMGIILASVLGPDKYAENFIKIQKAPGELEKTQAETEKIQAETEKAGQPKQPAGWHEGIDAKTGKPAVFAQGPDGQPVKLEGALPAPKQPLVQIGGANQAAGVDKQTAIDQAALAFVQGRGKWPTSRELKDEILGPAIIKARAIDPSLNQGTFALRQNAQKEADTGKIGQSNNSIMTVMGHLGHLKDVFKRMPDMGMKGLNWVGGKLKEQGPGGNPDLQEVQDLVEGIGPEMAKAYVPGAGSIGEREGWKERINPFRPIPERKANLVAFSSMLLTKLNQNEAQYLKAFKGLSPNAAPPPPQLTEDAYNTLKSIEEWTKKPIPGAAKWLKRYEETGGTPGLPTYTAPGDIPKTRTVTVDY